MMENRGRWIHDAIMRERTVRDDRNKSFRVRRSWERSIRQLLSNEERRALFRWQKRNRGVMWRSIRGMFVVVMIIILGCSVAWFWLLHMPSVPAIGRHCVLVIGMLACVLLLTVVRRKITPWLARGVLAIGRCANCGYVLQGLKQDDDGCAVCPECGAAWRAEQER